MPELALALGREAWHSGDLLKIVVQEVVGLVAFFVAGHGLERERTFYATLVVDRWSLIEKYVRRFATQNNQTTDHDQRPTGNDQRYDRNLAPSGASHDRIMDF